MEEKARNLEEMLKQKLAHYSDLLSVIERERGFIMAMDIESLWDACAQKRRITSDIEKLRKKILYLVKLLPFYSDMHRKPIQLLKIIRCLTVSKKMKSNMCTLYLDINGKKDELQKAASGNRCYVKEYLGVINDVMSTIVEVPNVEHYSAVGVVHAMGRSNSLINAEV